MIHVERYLEKPLTDDPTELATHPLLAAKALLQISAVREDVPNRLKKGLPVYRHFVRAKRSPDFKEDRHQFEVDVRSRISAKTLGENPEYYAGDVASIQFGTWGYNGNFEFNPEGHTSLAHIANSSTKTEAGIWRVANHWIPIEPSVLRYVKSNAEAVLLI